jgi:hypothetical protein
MQLAERFLVAKMNFYKRRNGDYFPVFPGKTSLYQADQQAGKRTSLVCNKRLPSPSPSCREQRRYAHFRAVGGAHVKIVWIVSVGGASLPALRKMKKGHNCTGKLNAEVDWAIAELERRQTPPRP